LAAEVGATYHTSTPWAILFGVAVVVVCAITVIRLVDLVLVDHNGAWRPSLSSTRGQAVAGSISRG
jgi:hypothetical protein